MKHNHKIERKGDILMLTQSDITALRMERQFLLSPSKEDSYDVLFSNMSPAPTIYWCEPGRPPTLPIHAAFDDYTYNSKVHV